MPPHPAVLPLEPSMTAADKGMGLGLRALNRLAGLELIDRVGLRELAERLVYRGTENGFKAANAAGRTLRRLREARPARAPDAGKRPALRPHPRRRAADDARGGRRLRFEKLRAAATTPTPPARPRPSCSSRRRARDRHAGRPRGARRRRRGALGGHVGTGHRGARRAAIWASPSRRSPAAVSTAIGLWGDADQQSTYLPEFTARTSPPRRSRSTSRATLRPLRAQDQAAPRRRRLHPRRRQVAGRARPPTPSCSYRAPSSTAGPALFIVEARTDGRPGRAEPAMGLRAAGTGEAQARRRQAPGRSAPRRRRPRRLRRVHPPRAASPGRRWRSAPRRPSLDYVIPYVNERMAFGEPISHRQAVAFRSPTSRSSSRACA